MSADPLTSARAKMRWAVAKAAEVRRQADSYLAGDPIRATPRERDRSVEIVAHLRTPLPEDLSLLVGEWAHSLRSALDHVVHAHVEDPTDRRRCAFPSWRKDEPPTPAQWARSVSDAVPGPRAAALRAVIEPLQPFRGGRDAFLWTLTELDNIDKHRVMLALTASIKTTQQVTRGHWVSEQDLASIDGDDGFVFQLSSDRAPSHPFIKDPTLADMLYDDIQLDVVYSSPEPKLRDDITRYKDYEADRLASDWIRNLMETSVTIVAMGVDVRGSGILYDGKTNREQQLRTQTARRFTVLTMEPFTYDCPSGIRAWVAHLRALEDDLFLLHKAPGMLSDDLADYLHEQTEGVIGVLTKWVSVTAMKAVGRKEKMGGEYLTEADFDETPIPSVLSLKEDVDPLDPPPTRKSGTSKRKKGRNSMYDQPPRTEAGAA